MNAVSRFAGLVSAALLFACTGATQPPQVGNVVVVSDVPTLFNDGSVVHITAAVSDAAGRPGAGSILFTASSGSVNGAGSTATATLDATGTAGVTFACDANVDPAHCGAQTVLISAAWTSLTGGTRVILEAKAAQTNPGGGSDAGIAPADAGTPAADAPTATAIESTGVTPSFLVTLDAINVAQNLSGTASAAFVVKDKDGKPFAGATVAFAEQPGESLVTLSPATATSDANGLVSVTVTSKTTRGAAHIAASIAAASATAVIPVVGGPTAIIETAAVPALLGLKGSGIQETGLMTFSVTDSTGNPIPGINVAVKQAQPALVVLGHATVVTDAAGNAVVDYSAGAQVGVTSIQATVVATGAVASHAVAVRGARPSASGLYFRCDHTNLPVYTTSLQYETTTCVVRLSDRYGNRVGIATPVGFAAESGSISASATTKPFDFANPTDPDEGSATVTFSSDMGIGFAPAETTPIAGEPSNGSLNPRDQLVTLIAMVRGEEAFVDTNLNGAYDPGELFVDQGDPFIDSNDNDAYDGDTEPRFCGGANCATYHGPNGTWDSDRTIWVPTWVAFTGAAVPAISTLAPSCVDYVDNDVANPSVTTANVVALDPWLNASAPGTKYTANLTSSAAGVVLSTVGGFDELENIGSVDVSWVKVSANDPTKACTVANTVNGACRMKTTFGGFDSGLRMTLSAADTNKTPAAAAPGHACNAASPGVGVGTFRIDVAVAGPHVTIHGATSGTFGF